MNRRVCQSYETDAQAVIIDHMRNALRFFVFLFAVFTAHAQASAALDADCSFTGSLDGIATPYGNTYHAAVPDNAVSSAVSSCFWSLSYLRFLNREGTFGSPIPKGLYDYKVHRVFPVYSRLSEKPVLIQSVTFID